MGTRLELHHDLCEVLGCPETGKDCRVYFQPTVNTQLKYPCILYECSTGVLQLGIHRTDGQNAIRSL